MPAFESRLLVSSMLLVAIGVPLQAEDDYLVGPRGTAMAGANTASTDDQDAQYYNPAAFGFFRDRDAKGNRLRSDNNDLGRKSWGIGLIDLTVQEQVQGNMAQYLNTLSSVDYKGLSNNGITSIQDAQNLVKLADSLSHVADPGNALTAQATAGTAVRIGHFCLGARISFEATAKITKLDETNLGLPSTTNLNQQLANSGATGDGTVQLFTPAEQTQLSNAGLNATSIQTLDYLARQNGVTAGDAAALSNLLSNVAAETNGIGGGGPLSSNQTTVLLKGFGLGEVPFSYGHAFGPHLSLGASLKLMIGRVYDTSVLVFQNDATQEIKAADKNYKQTINFGVDAGAMFRIPYLQFGIMGRNLNAPRFKGPTFNGITYSDVKVSPQATVGAAFIPFSTFVLEADCDLARADTTLDGYYQQRASFGGELNLLHFLALRGGAYKNIAEKSSPWVATAGIGLNLYLMRLDLGGAYSTQSSSFEGKKYPKEAAASLGLMIDF